MRKLVLNKSFLCNRVLSKDLMRIMEAICYFTVLLTARIHCKDPPCNLSYHNLSHKLNKHVTYIERT